MLIDDDIDYTIPANKLAKYKKDAEELKASLRAIDSTLVEMGYQLDDDSLSVKPKPIVYSGIRIKNKLSFRGEAMAKEYFDLLDEDKDGMLDFEDFRAMLSIQRFHQYGFVHEPEYNNWEAWKMYLADNGIVTNKYGKFGFDQFLEYRKNIELKFPLALELKRVGLGFYLQN